MKISLSIPEQNTVLNHGYGQASFGIVTSLQRLGHEVPFQDSTAPVELNFSQPYLWRWSSPDSYKIGMVAWESTKIPNEWKRGLTTCDELWTPSPIIAKWYEAEGYPVTTVYEHGVDAETWTLKKRTRREGPIRFLHIGEPAPRKGGQMTYDAFKELFGNKPDVATLTIKAHTHHTIRGTHNAHPDRELNNVKVLTNDMPEFELVDLVRRHDVLVYPTYGEGFGLIPLQAMATGMPVIHSQGWAPYENLMLPELRVPTRLDKSPWGFHTGEMLHPDRAALRDTMAYAVDHFEENAQKAFSLTPHVHRRYNWDRLTQRAFSHIVEKFS